MAEKKPVVASSVPMQIQEGGKALSATERIRRTFESGVVNSELSLMFLAQERGAKNPEEMTASLRGMPDWIWKADKEIADEFGGKFTIHAPENLKMDSPSITDKTWSADMLKHSIEVADQIGAKTITVHPSGSMGWALTNPMNGTAMGVASWVGMPEPLWRHVKKELETKGYDTMAEHLDAERNLQRNGTLLSTRMQFFTQADQSRRSSKTWNSVNDLYTIATSSGLSYSQKREELDRAIDRIKNDKEDGAITQLGSISKSLVEKKVMDKEVDLNDPNSIAKTLQNLKYESKDLEEDINEAGGLNKWLGHMALEQKRRWLLTDANAGSVPDAARQFFEGSWRSQFTEEQLKKIDNAVENNEDPLKVVPDLENKILEPFFDAFEKSMKATLSDKTVQEMLKKGDKKICIENIFGPNFKTGNDGFLLGWKPQHMYEVISRAKKVAKEYGLPEDVIGMTFDTQHALIVPEELGATTNLDTWVDELHKRGLKIDHAHLVGGHKRSHDVASHVGVGDLMDEVMREHPDIITKLAEAGALNIEPGTGSIKDVETGLETIWNSGTPAIAMAAEAGHKGGAEMMGYTQKSGSFYETAYNQSQANVIRGQFYFFQNPMERSAWQFALANTWYGAPSMFTPPTGAVTWDVTRLQKTWEKNQPY